MSLLEFDQITEISNINSQKRGFSGVSLRKSKSGFQNLDFTFLCLNLKVDFESKDSTLRVDSVDQIQNPDFQDLEYVRFFGNLCEKKCVHLLSVLCYENLKTTSFSGKFSWVSFVHFFNKYIQKWVIIKGHGSFIVKCCGFRNSHCVRRSCIPSEIVTSVVYINHSCLVLCFRCVLCTLYLHLKQVLFHVVILMNIMVCL